MIRDEEINASHCFLKRADVPLQFPQFRHAAALAHLAHHGRGPKYVLVGGSAWYDPADIREWLESKKTVGPAQRARTSIAPKAIRTAATPPPKRGRPTKLEQIRRRQAPYFSS
jgi:hypothetical protein